MDITHLTDAEIRAWLILHPPEALFRAIQSDRQVQRLVAAPSAADFFAGARLHENRNFWLSYLERWPHELNFDPGPYLTDGVYDSGHTNHPLYASHPETQYYEDVRQYVEAAMAARLTPPVVIESNTRNPASGVFDYQVGLVLEDYRRRDGYFFEMVFKYDRRRSTRLTLHNPTLHDIERHIGQELEITRLSAQYLPLSTSRRTKDTPASFYYNQVHYVKTHSSERQTSPRDDRPLKRSRTDVRAALNAAGGDVRAAAAALSML